MATALSLKGMPASRRASMFSRTLPNRSRPVICSNLSLSNVSRDRFTAFRPMAFNVWIWGPISVPLVVTRMSRAGCAARRRSRKSANPLRAKGSPPRQPDFFHAHVHRHVHKLFHLLIAQDGFVGNERLHAAAAVGAAQVAAVGNREADVADGPAVAVFQRSGGFAQMGEGWDCVHGTARWLCAARGGAVGRSLHRIPSSLAWQAVLCLCSRAASAMRLACSSSPGKLMLKKGRASARV